MKDLTLTPAQINAVTALIVEHKDMFGLRTMEPDAVARHSKPIYEAIATAIPTYYAIAMSGSDEAPKAVQCLIALDPFVKLFNEISEGTFKPPRLN